MSNDNHDQPVTWQRSDLASVAAAVDLELRRLEALVAHAEQVPLGTHDHLVRAMEAAAAVQNGESALSARLGELGEALTRARDRARSVSARGTARMAAIHDLLSRRTAMFVDLGLLQVECSVVESFARTVVAGETSPDTLAAVHARALRMDLLAEDFARRAGSLGAEDLARRAGALREALTLLRADLAAVDPAATIGGA